MTARILDVSSDDYFARPGFSQSCATTLINQSPLHAWASHPAYGGKERKSTRSMDRGSILHRLVLGAGKEYLALKFDDYKTKAAQAAKVSAVEAGFIPVLESDLADYQTAAANIRTELAMRGVTLDGQSEVAVEWDEETEEHGPVLCRGMIDHLYLNAGRILDLKITKDAAPLAVERSAENYGYAIQRAAYVRAVEALRPELAGRVDMIFVFAEAEPPYAMNISRPDGAFREIGERRWLRAVNEWGKCLAENHWPGYGSSINSITAPQWALMREEICT